MIFQWLDSQNIIQQLVCLLNPQVEKERHDNVAQLLCDFLVAARENQRIFDPDPLLKTLESWVERVVFSIRLNVVVVFAGLKL